MLSAAVVIITKLLTVKPQTQRLYRCTSTVADGQWGLVLTDALEQRATALFYFILFFLFFFIFIFIFLFYFFYF